MEGDSFTTQKLGGHGFPHVAKCQHPVPEKDVDSAQTTGEVLLGELPPLVRHQMAEGRCVGPWPVRVEATGGENYP